MKEITTKSGAMLVVEREPEGTRWGVDANGRLTATAGNGTRTWYAIRDDGLVIARHTILSDLMAYIEKYGDVLESSATRQAN